MKEVRLSQGFFAKVNDEDYVFLTSMGEWACVKGYAVHWNSAIRRPVQISLCLPSTTPRGTDVQ